MSCASEVGWFSGLAPSRPLMYKWRRNSSRVTVAPPASPASYMYLLPTPEHKNRESWQKSVENRSNPSVMNERRE